MAKGPAKRGVKATQKAAQKTVQKKGARKAAAPVKVAEPKVAGASARGVAKPAAKRRSVATAKQSEAATDPGMSDAAVQRGTGKAWGEWFAILDKAGATGMKHGEIAELLHGKLGVGAWWSQMVTVGYERARGMREKHQTPAGYQVSASKTIGVGVGRVFEAWSDERVRRGWLPEEITVRKATAGKSLRITWGDGVTHVDVNLYTKGDDKAQVSLEHRKLPDQAAAERLKAMWKLRLEGLRAMLEG